MKWFVPEVGDWLVCHDPDGSGMLTKDRTYEVREVFGDLIGLDVWPGHLWNRSRFRQPEPRA